jgi:hypothetical protein
MEYKVNKGSGPTKDLVSVITLDVPHGMRFMNAEHGTVQVECEAGKEMALLQHLQIACQKYTPLVLAANKQRREEIQAKEDEKNARIRATFPQPTATPPDFANRHTVIASGQPSDAAHPTPLGLGQAIVEGKTDVPEQH